MFKDHKHFYFTSFPIIFDRFAQKHFFQKTRLSCKTIYGPLNTRSSLEKTNEPILRKPYARQTDKETLFHWILLAMDGGPSSKKYLYKKLNRRITLSVPKYYKLDKKVILLMTNFVKDRRATNYSIKIIVKKFMS